MRFDRGVVHVVVILSTNTVLGLIVGSIVYRYCLRFDRGVVHVVLVGYSIYHYCLMFNRGVVHVALILSTITV